MYRISFRLVDRIIWNEPFFKESFEALLSKLWPKSEKGQSFGKRFSGLSGPNGLKLSQIFHQCLNSICTEFRSDWSTGSYETNRFLKSRLRRCCRSFGQSRKKVNLSESGSPDWVDQTVWNFHRLFINVLTQYVQNLSFRLVHRIIFNGVFFKESFQSVVIEALA